MKILPRLLSLLAALLCGFAAHSQAQTPSPAPATPATPDAPPAAAQQAIDPAKAVEIRKLLQLTGTSKLMEQMKTQMITMFKSQRPDAPDEVWTRLQSEMNTDELVEKLIPLYDKYYTLDELKAVNAFYASPAGQKMVATNPEIMHESMQIGQEWGQTVGVKVDEEIAKAKSATTPAPTPATPPTTPAQ